MLSRYDIFILILCNEILTSTTAYFTKRGVYAHKTRIAQSLFLKKYVRNQESERLCICVLGYRFLPLFDLYVNKCLRNIKYIVLFLDHPNENIPIEPQIDDQLNLRLNTTFRKVFPKH
jgi:hypothetical protein